jgi:hypothetical protein
VSWELNWATAQHINTAMAAGGQHPNIEGGIYCQH